MAYIHCCSALRKCRVFHLDTDEGLIEKTAYLLDECPVCGHTALVLKKVDFEGEVNAFRKINAKARKLFDKLRPEIIYEQKYALPAVLPSSKSYLKYNEYGAVKKCYSNLSAVKSGLFEVDAGLDFKKCEYLKIEKSA